MEQEIQNGSDGETFDYSLKDEKRNTDINVLLPLNSDLLREVTAQIVKKDLPR